MAKNDIPSYDAVAANNTEVQSVDISENCSPAGINNAIREVMADLKNVDTGAVALTSPSASQLNVDNLRLDGNTISSTDTNGNITLDPNGTGVTAITGGFTATDGCTITTADNTTQLTLTSTDDDAAVGPVMDFNRNSASAADNDLLGRLNFIGKNDAGEDVEYGFIRYKIADASDGSEDGDIAIKRMMAGTSSNMLNFKETETIFNEDSKDIDFRVESDGNANMLFVDAGNDRVGIGTASPSDALHIKTTADADIGLQVQNDDTQAFCKVQSGGTALYGGNGGVNFVSGSGFATRMHIASAGEITMPTQPAFLVQPNSEQSDIPINALTTITFDNERFDQNGDFASNTFTAPVTGKYLLTVHLYTTQNNSSTSYFGCRINTSNRNYENIFDPDTNDGNNAFSHVLSIVADMDANDTASIQLNVPNSGSAQTDINTSSFFSGALIC